MAAAPASPGWGTRDVGATPRLCEAGPSNRSAPAGATVVDDHPRFRWRTRLRRQLPWILINRGVAAKGTKDCGAHDKYNADGVVERCHHCEVGERPYDSEHFSGQ